MRVVAFLPAKSISERIFNKNVELLDGKPLLLHNLEKLCSIKSIDEVWLDTESEDIYRLADHLPIRWLKRDPALATNATDGHALFMNEVYSVPADVYVQVLATSPFLNVKTIEAAIEAVASGRHDSCVGVWKERHYLWQGNEPLYGKGRIPNSVELPEVTREAMSLYVVSREAALRTKRRFGDTPFLLELGPMEAIDVNVPLDFELAAKVAAGLREQDRVKLRILRTVLTSAALSDTFDDLDLDGVILGLRPNLPTARILGRANTLRLRAIEDGEDFRGIYDALGSYSSVIPNDIICVANETPQFAYFGEMNAHLAIRRGAVGMITNGATRDSSAVASLDFPTFAHSQAARDVRKRAVVGSMGKPIELCGVPIRHGDLVMADADGVCVIPRERERDVLEATLAKLRGEAHIVLDIGDGTDVHDIFERHGEF